MQTVSSDFQIWYKFEKTFGSQTWLKLLRNIQIDNIQPRFFNCVWKVWISKTKSSMIVALRANCWFLWFSNFFWSWKQKFLMTSHFFCCSKCFGQSKIFRTRLKYFYFCLQVFWIYRKTGLESRMFWKLFGYFWEIQTLTDSWKHLTVCINLAQSFMKLF